MTDIGEIGEQLVAHWLRQQGWMLRYHRWRCRWGEIDLIVQGEEPTTLAFVEVKTRRGRSWDEGGLLAIVPTKQRKLIVTAQHFLTQHPHLSSLPCRFDVALVQYRQNPQAQAGQLPSQLGLGQYCSWQGYEICLQNYLVGAFEG
ncbi:YraN family protein [Synechocystis sp. LKSZ1]|uniref:YraN family protein n=1 Tax=Synechocystis sp. LKSZ1 TaxID=3144951 RepID=UPI00336C1B9A